jgi:hypothetical protein
MELYTSREEMHTHTTHTHINMYILKTKTKTTHTHTHKTPTHQQVQVLQLVGVQDVHGVVHEQGGEERGGREDLRVVRLGDVGDGEALLWLLLLWLWLLLLLLLLLLLWLSSSSLVCGVKGGGRGGGVSRR